MPAHLTGVTGPCTPGAIWLKVNGQTKQQATLSNMIQPVAELSIKIV